MSEVDDFLSQMLPRYLGAVDAMHSGDPRPFVDMWARSDPVTLLGAAASMPPGWQSIRGPEVGCIPVLRRHPARLRARRRRCQGRSGLHRRVRTLLGVDQRRPGKAGPPTGDAGLPSGGR